MAVECNKIFYLSEDVSSSNSYINLLFRFLGTQPAGSQKPPDSNISSGSSLGKRKASDMSSISSSSTTPVPPLKIPRRTLAKEDEDNPFLDNPEIDDENPTSPVCLVCFLK